MKFDRIDFSYSDFERCEFFSCNFNSSKFKEARFFATNYRGCIFQDIKFNKTNFGHSTFTAGGVFFKRIKNNFMDATFEQVNFSEVHFNDQRFKNCQFSNCKTGALMLSKCILINISFRGMVRNLFFIESRKVENVDFGNAVLSGISLEKQTLYGFLFPKGDTYYKFVNKSKELTNLKFQVSLTDEETKLVEAIKFAWFRNNLETDFVDVNWLRENEIETGKLIIKELKKGDNIS